MSNHCPILLLFAVVSSLGACLSCEGDPVDVRERDGEVTETLRPGYRLGGLVIRPARVAVGRYTAGSESLAPQPGEG